MIAKAKESSELAPQRPYWEELPVGETQGKSVSADDSTGPQFGPVAFATEDPGRVIRAAVGWGEQFIPKVRNREDYVKFRALCDGILSELQRIDGFIENEVISDDGSPAMAEILHALDEMFDCKWGQDESLQTVVTLVQSQVENANWTTRHISFLRDVLALLRGTYWISEATVEDCEALIDVHQLDFFRGTIMATEVRKKYRIVEEL